MSGRAKGTIYLVFVIVLALCMIAGKVLMAYSFATQAADLSHITLTILIFAFMIVLLVLPLNVLVHELGHLLFGALCGMKFVSVSVGKFTISRKGIRLGGKRGYAGKTEMMPASSNHIRGRMIAFALGGVLMNFVYGVVFLTLYFTIPVTPALFFFELFAPLNLFEGLVALFPAGVSAGKTDGKVMLDIARHTPDSEVFLSVFVAQGMLRTKTYGEIPRGLLFDLPVVREDLWEFLALTQLRWQYLFYTGDKEGAKQQILRLESLLEYFEADLSELYCDVAYGYYTFLQDRARAEELLNTKTAERSSLAYLRTHYVLTGEGEEDLRAALAKEKNVGIRLLEEKLVEREEV